MLRFLLVVFVWALAACSCCSSLNAAAALVPHNSQAFMLLPSAHQLSLTRARRSVDSVDPDEELTFEAQSDPRLQQRPHRFETDGQHAGAGGYLFGPPPPPSLPFGPKGGGKKGYASYVMLLQPVQPVVTPVVTPVIREVTVQPRVEVRTIVRQVLIDEHSEAAPITEKPRVVSHTEAALQPTQSKKSSGGGLSLSSSGGLGLGTRYAPPTITTLQPVSGAHS